MSELLLDHAVRNALPLPFLSRWIYVTFLIFLDSCFAISKVLSLEPLSAMIILHLCFMLLFRNLDKAITLLRKSFSSLYTGKTTSIFIAIWIFPLPFPCTFNYVI